MNFDELARNTTDATHKEIFQIIADSAPKGRTTDGGKEPIPLTLSQCEEIKDIHYKSVYEKRIAGGESVQTFEEARQSSVVKVQDAFFNPVNGIGTGIDPGYYNQASIPVSMSPNQATAMYSSGGLSAEIIDKKAQGVFSQGYFFESSTWDQGDLETLLDYAEKKGFSEHAVYALTDALTFGGSMLVPQFKGDNAETYEMSQAELLEERVLQKDCLERFWSADRWSCVLIPNWNFAAEDYLNPKVMYVPVTGYTVKTWRAAILRPKRLPHWAALRQMGWCTSDYEGWMASLLAYEVGIRALPVMMQQMSLMYRHIPLDAQIMGLGANSVKNISETAGKQMVEWSNTLPQTFNSLGEIKTVERHFTDYDKLNLLLRQDLAANCGFPESVLFHSQSTGFSDNEEDVTLKQAETIKRVAEQFRRSVRPIIDILILSCFGPDSEQYKCREQVDISFDSPTIVTTEQRTAQAGAFAQVLTAGISAQLRPDQAIKVANTFTPEIEIPQEIVDEIKGVLDAGETDPNLLGNNVGPAVEEILRRLHPQGPAVENLGDQLRGEDEQKESPTGIRGVVDRIAKGVRGLWGRLRS